MSVLFSPVGTADPLTQLGDGPMLHIVRHYRPDRVVLFLSPAMREHQERDHRYTEAIERLSASDGRKVPVMELVDAVEKEVYRFDSYIGEFEGILARLCEESPGEPVLVNVTSGTPQWLAALVALGAFGSLDLRLLQVTTPRRGVNKQQDRERQSDYDLDGLWEWNESLREEDPEARESRVIEVETPNFSDRLLRENVVRLVRAYNYPAAFELASQMRDVDPNAMAMIAAARDRLNLDGALPAKVFARTELAYRPNDPLGEYLSVMEVRLAQGNWADFVRLLTPALSRICRDELERCGLPEHAYLLRERNRQTSKLDWDLIARDRRLRDVFGNRRPGDAYVTNAQLVKLVENNCTDRRVTEKIVKLREFESKCRNPLAHDLTASSRGSLERLGGLPLDTVMQYLEDLHGCFRPHLYQRVSQAIIESL